MAADGTVLIDTKIDADGMQKGFEQIKSGAVSVSEQVKEISNDLSTAFGGIDITKPMVKAQMKIDELKQQILSVESSLDAAAASGQTETNNADVARMVGERERLYEQLSAAQQNLALDAEFAAQREAQAAEKAAQREAVAAEKAAQREVAATKKAEKEKERAEKKRVKESTNGIRHFGSRLKEITMGALVFNAISAGLRSVTQYMGTTLKSNQAFATSLARVKGSLLTAFQPIYEAVLPILISFMNILNAVIQAIGKFFAALSGKSYSQMQKNSKALNKQAGALGGVGDAAEEAKKQLMGFDEINKLSDTSTSGGGGGGGGGSGEIEPIFDEFNTDEYKSKIDELTTYVSGALLALGAILAFSGANAPLGIALMAAGAVGLATVVSQNWGAMSDELRGALTDVAVILGAAALAVGAVLAFSGANLPLGIGLMAAGVAGLAAAVALNWSSIEEALQGPIGGVTAAVSGALLAIGAILAFSGVNLPLGIGLMAAGAIGLATTAAVNWNTIKDALQGPIGGVIAVASAALLALGAILTFSGANLPLGIALMAAGAVGLVSMGALNWNAILNKLKEVWGSIKNWFNSSVAPKLTLAYWQEKFSTIANALAQKIKDGVNGAIASLNGMISAAVNAVNSLFRLLSFNIDLPWGGSIGMSLPQFKAPQIPYLAQGAVIPPNREFMAVLGDQTSGNNIEAPEALIRKIVREETARGTSNTEIIIILKDILEAILGIEIGDEVIGKAAMRYMRRNNRAMGV